MRQRFFVGGLTAATLIAFAAPALPEQVRYFGGYRCTDGCKGHAAGFQWARQHRITNPAHCTWGPSESHMQGCRVYSRDRMRDATKDDAGRAID